MDVPHALRALRSHPHPTLCLYNFHLPQSDMITLDNLVIFSKLQTPRLY